MATRCGLCAAPSMPASCSQRRAEAALVMVSCVVKVLLATIISVVSGSRPRSVLCRAPAAWVLAKRTRPPRGPPAPAGAGGAPRPPVHRGPLWGGVDHPPGERGGARAPHAGLAGQVH